MTNKEYIEKNNISFSDAMKMWNNKASCINDWLNQEHQEHKFKVGDFIIKDGVDTEIGIVIDVKDKVYFKILNRDDHHIFVMGNESNYKKIF